MDEGWNRGSRVRLAGDTPPHAGWPLVAVFLMLGCASGGGGEDRSLDAVAFAPVLQVSLEGMTPTAGGVLVRDLRTGEGAEARPGRKVTVHYQGWLPDGRQVDTTREDGVPVSFTLGRREVIRGWEEGVAGMKVGGVRQLVIPPRMGYGRQGVPGMIPPNATLVFEIELLQVGEQG